MAELELSRGKKVLIDSGGAYIWTHVSNFHLTNEDIILLFQNMHISSRNPPKADELKKEILLELEK